MMHFLFLSNIETCDLNCWLTFFSPGFHKENDTQTHPHSHTLFLQNTCCLASSSSVYLGCRGSSEAQILFPKSRGTPWRRPDHMSEPPHLLLTWLEGALLDLYLTSSLCEQFTEILSQITSFHPGSNVEIKMYSHPCRWDPVRAVTVGCDALSLKSFVTLGFMSDGAHQGNPPRDTHKTAANGSWSKV